MDNVSEQCFMHTLQRVIKDGFKYAVAVNKVLAKTVTFMSLVHNPSMLQSCLKVISISKLPVSHNGIPSWLWSGQYFIFHSTSSVLWICNGSLFYVTQTFWGTWLIPWFLLRVLPTAGRLAKLCQVVWWCPVFRSSRLS